MHVEQAKVSRAQHRDVGIGLGVLTDVSTAGSSGTTSGATGESAAGEVSSQALHSTPRLHGSRQEVDVLMHQLGAEVAEVGAEAVAEGLTWDWP